MGRSGHTDRQPREAAEAYEHRLRGGMYGRQESGTAYPHGREESAPPPQQRLKGALSQEGVVNMADPTHDKGKSTLLHRFRGREERYRRNQARAGAGKRESGGQKHTREESGKQSK